MENPRGPKDSIPVIEDISTKRPIHATYPLKCFWIPSKQPAKERPDSTPRLPTGKNPQAPSECNLPKIQNLKTSTKPPTLSTYSSTKVFHNINKWKESPSLKQKVDSNQILRSHEIVCFNFKELYKLKEYINRDLQLEDHVGCLEYHFE